MTAASPSTTRSTVIPQSVADNTEPGIRVTELGSVDRLMWESNILYGLGRVEDVRTMAMAAQQKGSESGYQAAMALMRLDGNRQGFEDMAVEYAVLTGNSPPVWLKAHDRQKAKEATAPSRLTINVTSLATDNIIETTIKLESPLPVWLDLGGVTRVDNTGIVIFNESLTGRIQRQEKTRVFNADRLLNNLIRRLKSASYQEHADLWSFCFNCMKLSGAKEAFDALALPFVEKSGQDLPQWEDLSGQEDEALQAQAPTPHASVGHPVPSALSKVNPELVRTLAGTAAYQEAKKRKTALSLDFALTSQWAIADMAGVQAFIRLAHADGVRLEFFNLNEMLAALMKAFAIDKTTKLAVAGDIT